MKLSITAVIIGYNEAENLKAAVQSIRQSGISDVIYIDSSSTDDSVEIAEKHGAETIVINNIFRSPGMARNIGVEQVKAPFVLLMDGDMVLDPHFLEKAVPLFDDSKVACVTGIIKEKYPTKNIFHRAISINWRFPHKGSVITPAGGGLFRTKYFRQVKGYNVEIPAGEEIELRNKFYECGYTIKTVDSNFAEHDLGIDGLGDYIKRVMREVRLQDYALTHPDDSYVKCYKVLVVKNFIITLILIILLFFSIVFLNPFYLVVPVIVILVLGLLKNTKDILQSQDPVGKLLFLILGYLKKPLAAVSAAYYLICTKR